MANVGRPKKQGKLYTEKQLAAKFAEYKLWETEQNIQQMSYFLYETIMLLKSDILKMAQNAEQDVVTQQQLNDLGYFMRIVCEKDSEEYKSWLKTSHRIRSKLTARKKREENNQKSN